MSVTSPSIGRQPTLRDRIRSGGLLRKRTVSALAAVLILVFAMGAVWINVLQAQVPRNMPFGVVGASPVVTAAQSQKIAGHSISFAITGYPDEAAAMRAIDHGDIYGAYIQGKSNDTLLTSQAKSFFAYTEVVPLFDATATQLGRPLQVQVVKPLPAGKDPVGAVTGFLMLAAVVGGMVAAILVFTLTGLRTQRWRGLLLLLAAATAAVVNDLIAGPLVGSYAGDRFWPLLPCFFLITTVSALIGAVLYALFKPMVALLALFIGHIVLGLITAGNVALQPTYWQTIGGLLTPRYGSTLIQNVLYFSSNGIATPIAVLVSWAVVASLVLAYLEYVRPRRVRQTVPAQRAAPTVQSDRVRTARVAVAVVLVSSLYTAAFALAYGSAQHNPVTRDLPFAVTGSSPLTSAVQQQESLDVTTYPDVAAAKGAIDRGEAWGALIPGQGQSTLLTVPSISDLAPYTLAASFEAAAKSQGEKLTVTPYTPTPLPHGDPFGLVLAILLTPLLVGGYVSATVLKGATKIASAPLQGAVLIAFAIVASLMLDLIAGPWLGGIASGKFWILWPIMALTMSVAALIGAVLQRLLGAVGTLLTVAVIIWLGKPSSGGANGVFYLPHFWSALGPYLPPRNAFVLMRNTVYFGGHGTTQALLILLGYFVVFVVILGFLDWRRWQVPEVKDVTHETEDGATAVAVPAGAAV